MLTFTLFCASIVRWIQLESSLTNGEVLSILISSFLNLYVLMGKCDSQQSIKIADIFLNPPFTATGVNQSFVIENATTTNSKVENSKCHQKQYFNRWCSSYQVWLSDLSIYMLLIVIKPSTDGPNPDLLHLVDQNLVG